MGKKKQHCSPKKTSDVLPKDLLKNTCFNVINPSLSKDFSLVSHFIEHRQGATNTTVNEFVESTT